MSARGSAASGAPAVRSSSGPGRAGVSAGRTLYAYVTDNAEKSLTVVNLSTFKIHRIPTGIYGFDSVVTPDGRWAYETSFGLNGKTGTQVVPVDLADGKALKPLPAGLGTNDTILSPNGKTVFIADMGTFLYASTTGLEVVDAYTVSTLDTATNTVGPRITVGPGPGALAMTPDGRTLWVTLTGTAQHPVDQIIPVSWPSRQVGRPVTVGTAPMAIAITPDDKEAVVANTGCGRVASGDSVSVIDLRSNLVVATVRVGLGPVGIAVSPDGTTAWVALEGGPSPGPPGTRSSPSTSPPDRPAAPCRLAPIPTPSPSPTGPPPGADPGPLLGQGATRGWAWVCNAHRQLC